MHRIRPRMPSPAMAVALLALLVALGGSATAAFGPFKGNKIIKKHSLSGNRLKNGTVTGTQIKVSSLGTVPSATNANRATSAGTASNAASVDGMSATSFTYAAQNGSTKSVVLNDYEGLTLKASCSSGANNGLTTYADTTSNAGLAWDSISRSGTKLAGGQASNDAYGTMSPGSDYTMTSPGGTVDTGNGTGDFGYAVGQIVYSQPGGSRVTVNWSYDNDVTGYACYWTGTVLASPGGGQSSAADRRGISGSAPQVSQAQRAAQALRH